MLEFIKNIKPSFEISKIPMHFERLKLDNRNHYENKAIKGLDRVASTQNKVWHENLPNKVIQYINEFGYDETQYSANINLQQPGQMAPLHKDNHGHACNKFNRPPEDFIRLLVFLTDWSMGQVFGCEDKTIIKWKAGDCYTFDSDDQHFSANTGTEDKYTIVISAIRK